MITVTTTEAQRRFPEILDQSQIELVEVTREGQTVAYLLSGSDMQDLIDLRQRRANAARRYARYREASANPQRLTTDAEELTDEAVDGLVHELR